VLGWFGVKTQHNGSWILRDNELVLCEELVDVPRLDSNGAVMVTVWDRRAKHLGTCGHTWGNCVGFCLCAGVGTGFSWLRVGLNDVCEMDDRSILIKYFWDS
jgi:hypothetical protein